MSDWAGVSVRIGAYSNPAKKAAATALSAHEVCSSSSILTPDRELERCLLEAGPSAE